jgi:micrococcal nuclease
MSKKRLGTFLVFVSLAVAAWYLNTGSAGTGGVTAGAPVGEGAPATNETGLKCHTYTEHRKDVPIKLDIPTLSDAKAPLYKVLEVTDGDTIVVSKGGKEVRVRFMGMDTPEKSTTRYGYPEYYGQEAYEHALALIRESDSQVHLTYDKTKQDKYGRDLAYVWLKDGRMLNALMVADGYAYSYTSSPKPQYVDQFLALMRDSRERNRGLWAFCQ